MALAYIIAPKNHPSVRHALVLYQEQVIDVPWQLGRVNNTVTVHDIHPLSTGQIIKSKFQMFFRVTAPKMF